MKNLKLIAVLILLPLCISLAGVWESHRNNVNYQDRTDLQTYINQIRPKIVEMVAKPGTQFVQLGDSSLPAGMALSEVDAAARDLNVLLPLGRIMAVLATLVIALGLLAAVVGVFGLAWLWWAGGRVERSRDQLLSTFTQVRRFLPYVLVGHTVTTGAAVAAVLAFEGLGTWHEGRLVAGDFKLMFGAAVFVLFGLYSLWQMVKQLRVMLLMFEPTPMPVLGEAVTQEQAPVLWARVRGLASELGALVPEQVVLGMSDGFYVTSSDVQLLPSQTLLRGRTLHVPVMYLGLLDRDEVNAVIGHELGHFAGEDTTYSQRFLPIYDGIGRSLGLIAETMIHSDRVQRAILRPAYMLGAYFMERFDHAVHHWGRIRELAADGAGAKVAGNLAIASALVRISAIDPLLQAEVAKHVQRAIQANGDEGLPTTDLSTAVIEALSTQRLSLPPEQMAVQLPHPSDTHPSNGERLKSLQVTVEDAVGRATRSVDAEQARAALDQYFADGAGVCARLTADYLGHHQSEDALVVERLRSYAGDALEEVTFKEGARKMAMVSVGLNTIFCGVGIFAMLIPLLFAGRYDGPTGMLQLAGVGLVALMLVMLVMLIFPLRLLRRADKTALTMTPTHFVFANLAAPLPIHHIADFRVMMGPGVRLQLLLEDDAPLPVVSFRSFFAPCAQLNKKQRMIELVLARFTCEGKKLSESELAEQVGTYLAAGNARYLLEQRLEAA